MGNFQIIIGIMCIAQVFSITLLESESSESGESEDSEESEAKTDKPIMKSCRGPDLKEGVCTHLEDCIEMIDSFVTPLNEITRNFINASKNVCYAQNANGICCPISTSYKISTKNLLLPSESCGLVQKERYFPVIVGGRNSEIGAWPWLALIFNDRGSEFSFLCTGSIITTRHVVTAAHCVSKALSFVRLGEYDMSNDTETEHVDMKVTKWLVHENFQINTRLNNLAILFLAKEVQFTDLIAPICLPVSLTLRGKSYVGSKSFVAGWGHTRENGIASEELQTTVLDNDVCYKTFKLKVKSTSKDQLDSSVLCVGNLNGANDTCQGDSGGPLMLPELIEGQMRFFIIGVVSYSLGCARKDMAAVFTNIPYHMDWILKQLN